MTPEMETAIKSRASDVLLPTSDPEVANVHVSYFLGIRETMTNEGYANVKVRYPGVSENVAQSLQMATLQQIHQLCNAEVCIVRLGVNDESLLRVLKNTKDAHSLLLLNLLNGTKGNTDNE